MTSCINLKRIKVSGWKAIRDPIEIAFDGKSWLIHGENEVGKSSIFSSIRFALFEYPETKGTFSDNWVHNASAEATVELDLLIDGAPYTIHKTRTQKRAGMTRLFDGIGSSRSEHSTGKDAANAILALVGAAERSGRADEIPKDWGILAWLLAPQGMDSVSPAREHATKDLGLERTMSPELHRVQEQLEADLGDELTQGGKKADRSPRKGGTLKSAIDGLGVIREKKEAVEARRVKYTEELQELGRKKDAAAHNQAKLEEASEAHLEQQDARVDVAKLEGEIKELEATVKAKQAEVEADETAAQTLVAIQEDIARHEEELGGAVKEITLKAAKKSGLTDEIRTLEEQLKIYSASLREKNKSIEESKGRIIEGQRSQRLVELREKLARLDEIEAEIVQLMEDGEIPDADGLGELSDLAQGLERAENMLRSLAETGGVSVALAGDLDARWVVDGQDVELDPTTRFARKLVIDGGGFTVSLRREETDGTDWIQTRADGLEQLEQMDLSTVEELRELIRSHQRREERRRALLLEKTMLGAYESLTSEIHSLSEGEIPDLDDIPDIQSLEVEIKSQGDERTTLERDIEAADASLVELSTRSHELGGQLKELRAKEEASKALLAAATKRRDGEIEQSGTLETRKMTLDERSEELAALNKDLARQQKLKQTQEDAQKTEVKKAFRVKGQLERQQRNLDAEVLSLQRACEERGGEGLQRKSIDLECSLAEAEALQDQIERQVRAEERLLNRFRRALTAATDLEIGPIKDQVEEWLAQVTEGRWTRVEMDSRLDVTMLQGPDRTIPGEQVGSMGLQQVIHALIRLAVATNIHKSKSAELPDFPAVALVMDESQSHVSEERVVRLTGIFNRQIAEGRVQVVALSHRRDEFQSLNAMNYDVQRREAYDPDSLSSG